MICDQPIKKVRILLIYLGFLFLGGSHFAYGNMEFSTHFSKKFQKNGAWNFGVDTLYRSLKLRSHIK